MRRVAVPRTEHREPTNDSNVVGVLGPCSLFRKDFRISYLKRTGNIVAKLSKPNYVTEIVESTYDCQDI